MIGRILKLLGIGRVKQDKHKQIMKVQLNSLYGRLGSDVKPIPPRGLPPALTGSEKPVDVEAKRKSRDRVIKYSDRLYLEDHETGQLRRGFFDRNGSWTFQTRQRRRHQISQRRTWFDREYRFAMHRAGKVLA